MENFNEELLISLVHENRNLWDRELEDYSDSKKAHSSWVSIAEIMKINNIKIVKDKWRNLRDTYVRTRRNVLSKCAGRSKCPIKKWKFYNEMSFLNAFLKPCNQSSESSLNDDVDNLTDNSTLDNLSHPISTSKKKFTDQMLDFNHEDVNVPTIKTEDNLMDFNIHSDNIFTMCNVTKNGINSNLPHNPFENYLGLKDEEAAFGSSIAAALRKISPLNKSRAKLRIQEIIYEIEQEEFSTVPRCKKTVKVKGSSRKSRRNF